jgi:glycosyltransferase involved in cell wall biosynthesis
LDNALKKNVAFVVFEPHLSGQGRAVADIFTQAAGQFNFFLICQQSNASLHEHCRVIVEGSLPLKISKFLNGDLMRAYRFVKANNIDLIHLHGFEGLLWGHALAMMAGVPLIFTPHTIDMRSRFLFKFYQIAWRMCSLYASMLITVSREDARTVIKRKIIAARKVRPILLGVDQEKFNLAALPRPQIDGVNEKKWIVQVGHLSYQKNPSCLVRAAALLLPRNPDLLFLFVGEGPLKKQLETEIAQHGLGASVMVLGHRSDALQITGNAHIVVNTSRWEGMPFTLIDACFLGRAIVASAVNGTKDLIEEGVSGLLFTPDRAQELAQKMYILLCNDSLRVQLGEGAKKAIAGSHSMAEMGRQHIAAYEQVLAKRV